MEQAKQGTLDLDARMSEAIRRTAPGTALRHALDMIIAGHLGAIICVGDSDAVLAAGNDGFPLNISFTANRLFELSKMDGAIVVDRELTQILRANFHLNPDGSLPTSETGMRHRTAARMSLLTDAMVISVSERRQVVSIYVGGRSHQLRSISEVMTSANQLLVSMQATRQAIDRKLIRLTSIELDNHVVMSDIVQMFSLFELLIYSDSALRSCIEELGREGRNVEMQRQGIVGDADEEYTLMVRDYARDSSPEAARAIRERLANLAAKQALSSSSVSKALGLEEYKEDTVVKPLGLRTLSRISVVREGIADKIVDEYGSLQELMDDIKTSDSENPARVEDLGVREPTILIDSLYRLWGKK